MLEKLTRGGRARAKYNAVIEALNQGVIMESEDFLPEVQPDGRVLLRCIWRPSLRTIADARCWAVDNVDLLWPEETPPSQPFSFASANAGWWWHKFCRRTFRYTRDVATGALSNRTVWNYHGFLSDILPFEEEGYFDTLPTISNWYEPTAVEVTTMLGYVPAEECSGDPSATMEVMLLVEMWRERKFSSPPGAPWTGWDERLPENTGSWPLIRQVAWRYI